MSLLTVTIRPSGGVLSTPETLCCLSALWTKGISFGECVAQLPKRHVYIDGS